MNDVQLSPERLAALQRTEVIAGKVNLLLETIMTKSGQPFDYASIRDGALAAGYYLSRTRWSLLKHGREQVLPDEALYAVARAFGVDPNYLLEEDGDLPGEVRVKFDQVRVKRRAEVRDAATRALGLVDPQALKEISKILDSDA